MPLVCVGVSLTRPSGGYIQAGAHCRQMAVDMPSVRCFVALEPVPSLTACASFAHEGGMLPGTFVQAGRTRELAETVLRSGRKRKTQTHKHTHARLRPRTD